MPAPVWPVELPQRQELEFEFTPGDNRILTDMDQGPAKVRMRTGGFVDLLRVPLTLTHSEAVRFLEFVRVEVPAAGHLFTWQHPVTDAAQDYLLLSYSPLRQIRGGELAVRLYRTDLALRLIPAAA